MAVVEYLGGSNALVVYRVPSGSKYRFASGKYNKHLVRGEANIAYFERLGHFKVMRTKNG